jgi:hypothetical protein
MTYLLAGNNSFAKSGCTGGVGRWGSVWPDEAHGRSSRLCPFSILLSQPLDRPVMTPAAPPWPGNS